MINLAVIDITGLSPLAGKEIFGGASALDRVRTWAKGIPNYGGTVFLAKPGDPVPSEAADFNSVNLKTPCAIYREEWNEEELIAALELIGSPKTVSGEGNNNSAEALFFVRGDSPLIDEKVTHELWKLHYTYDAEYTFADGYPVGLAPEILSRDLAGKLKALAIGRKGDIARDSLFEILRQDINAFDVETHLSPSDLRMDRVSITCDTRRNISIAETLYAAGGRDAESLCRVIPDSKGLLRNLPAYFPIQVCSGYAQGISYLPDFTKVDPSETTEPMDAETFTELCRSIVEFAGDAVFDLSLRCEPSMHPEIGSLIDAALSAGESDDREPVTRVLIETSGLGWDPSLLERLAADYNDGRLMWILDLDAADTELYKSLRGEGQPQAEETARHLIRLFGRHCWIQAVRMNENEDDLEAVYKKWKDEGAQVIVQKYNSYGTTLPERQPSDLSPLKRFPCWHLKRDLPVLLDGRVPICQSSLGSEDVLGNAFEESLSEIWNRGSDLHDQHVKGEYPGVCGKCDEYYTFNF